MFLIIFKATLLKISITFLEASFFKTKLADRERVLGSEKVVINLGIHVEVLKTEKIIARKSTRRENCNFSTEIGTGWGEELVVVVEEEEGLDRERGIEGGGNAY